MGLGEEDIPFQGPVFAHFIGAGTQVDCELSDFGIGVWEKDLGIDCFFLHDQLQAFLGDALVEWVVEFFQYIFDIHEDILGHGDDLLGVVEHFLASTDEDAGDIALLVRIAYDGERLVS